MALRERWQAWRVAARNRSLASECFYCGAVFTEEGSTHRTVDHRVPRSRGGSQRLGNLVFACFACNQRKANSSEAEFMASAWLAERRAQRSGGKNRG